MADRKTLEQQLRDAGETVPEYAPCPNPLCGRERCRPFEIVETTDRDAIPSDMACTQCLGADDRERAQIDEWEKRQALDPWDTPEGLELKAQRNRMLDAWRWTIMPDSPLTEDCQTAFKHFLYGWQRMTIDAAVISAFNAPPVPDLEYAPDDEYKRNLGI